MALMLTSWDSHEPILQFLMVLALRNPFYFSNVLRAIMIDVSSTEEKAITKFSAWLSKPIMVCTPFGLVTGSLP
jgi:hypothetical protein